MQFEAKTLESRISLLLFFKHGNNPRFGANICLKNYEINATGDYNRLRAKNSPSSL